MHPCYWPFKVIAGNCRKFETAVRASCSSLSNSLFHPGFISIVLNCARGIKFLKCKLPSATFIALFVIINCTGDVHAIFEIAHLFTSGRMDGRS